MQKHERMIRLLEKMKGLGMKQGLLSNIDLSLSQFSMLIFVARMPGCRANEVADAMGLSAATVSVALRKLEDEGWISRKEDPDDKRASRLGLTEKGEQMKTRMLEHLHRSAYAKDHPGEKLLVPCLPDRPLLEMHPLAFLQRGQR